MNPFFPRFPISSAKSTELRICSHETTALPRRVEPWVNATENWFFTAWAVQKALPYLCKNKQTFDPRFHRSAELYGSGRVTNLPSNSLKKKNRRSDVQKEIYQEPQQCDEHSKRPPAVLGAMLWSSALKIWQTVSVWNVVGHKMARFGARNGGRAVWCFWQLKKFESPEFPKPFFTRRAVLVPIVDRGVGSPHSLRRRKNVRDMSPWLLIPYV